MRFGRVRGGDLRGHRVRTAADLPTEPCDRVEASVNDSLFQRSDRVVGDVDALWTDFGTAFGDVAEPDAHVLRREHAAVDGVERVHLQLGEPDEESWAREDLLVLFVVTDDVTDVLAQEALD